MFDIEKIKHTDCAKILKKMMDLSDFVGFYMLDQDQRIQHWYGAEMEKITGTQRDEILGLPCTEAFSIAEFSDDKQELIRLTTPEAQNVEIIKYTQTLHQNDGSFAGGFGILQRHKKSQTFNSSAKEDTLSDLNFYGMISRSPAMEPVFQLIQNAAETEVTVLVRGESGSGKELVAKAIHDLSPRKDAPFLAINCAALSSNLLESELFGHVRGAFTGAIKDHRGLFSRADGGTLFLDEVAELPLDLQAKLLRVLQERNYIPVGGDKAYNVDVRIVAATHRALREEVKQRRFREDLMYRLRVVPIFIPPLRERREDINLLLWHFIEQHNNKKIRQIEHIEPDAMRVLMDYAWPGNIRELQNVVEYAFVVGQGTNINLADLPPEFRERQQNNDHNAYHIQEKPYLSADEEAAAIRQALQQNNGKVTLAAQSLGMSRATFWRKRKMYGL